MEKIINGILKHILQYNCNRLQLCTNVKTVRLCLQLGREGKLPWAAKLDPATLPTGSDRPWVSRSADGLLVLKR
jgi:hypothetical protein